MEYIENKLSDIDSDQLQQTISVEMRIPEQSYHPFRFIVTTDSAAL
jgi:hypothetical protein